MLQRCRKKSSRSAGATRDGHRARSPRSSICCASPIRPPSHISLSRRVRLVEAKLLENSGDLNVERPTKGEDVSIIGLIRRIRGVAADLELGGLTLNRFVRDHPSALERTHLEG